MMMNAYFFIHAENFRSFCLDSIKLLFFVVMKLAVQS